MSVIQVCCGISRVIAWLTPVDLTATTGIKMAACVFRCCVVFAFLALTNVLLIGATLTTGKISNNTSIGDCCVRVFAVVSSRHLESPIPAIREVE